jgi:hypothetical protein
MADPLGALLLAEETPEDGPEALTAQQQRVEGQDDAAATATAAGQQQQQQHAPSAPVPSAVGPACRAAQFRAALAADCIDLRRLRELAWGGVPDGEADRGLRGAVWRLLLGLLPREQEQWERTLRRKRTEYAQFCEVGTLCPPLFSCAAPACAAARPAFALHQLPTPHSTCAHLPLAFLLLPTSCLPAAPRS